MLEIEYLKNDIEKLLQLLGSVPEVRICLIIVLYSLGGLILSALMQLKLFTLFLFV